jgi:hypothetical protein
VDAVNATTVIVIRDVIEELQRELAGKAVTVKGEK